MSTEVGCSSLGDRTMGLVSASTAGSTALAKLAICLATLLWPAASSSNTQAPKLVAGAIPPLNSVDDIKTRLVQCQKELDGVIGLVQDQGETHAAHVQELQEILVGITDSSEGTGVESSKVDDTETKERILELSGKFSLALLKILQLWLQQGLTITSVEAGKDYILSIQERQTILRLTRQVVGVELTILGRKILQAPQTSSNETNVGELKSDIVFLLSVVHPSSTSCASSTSTPISNLQGPPKLHTDEGHITLITAQLRALPNLSLLLSYAILVGWNQSFPPAEMVEVRRQTIKILEDLLPPADSLAILGAVRGMIKSQNGALEKIRLEEKKRREAGRRTPKIELIDDDHDKHGDSQDKAEIRRGAWPEYVARTVNVLMAKQVVRKGGIRGLMTNISGTMMSKSEVLETNKLDHLARVLRVVVPGWKPEEYYDNVFKQVVSILTRSNEDAGLPDRYSHAAAYVLQHLSSTLKSDQETKFLARLKGLIQPAFQPVNPLLLSMSQDNSASASSDQVNATLVSSADFVASSLAIILPLLTRVPPSSEFIDSLLTPIIAPFFALFCELETDPTADPMTKREIKECLEIWVRTVDEGVAVKGIWRILTSGRGWGLEDEEGRCLFWGKEFTEEGAGGLGVWYGRKNGANNMGDFLNLHRERSDGPEILFRPAQVESSTDKHQSGRAPSAADITEDEALVNELDLQPSPKQVVQLTKKARTDTVAAQIYVRCLTSYGELTTTGDQPIQAMLFLQVVMRMTSENNSAISKNPEQILVFVEHALRSATTTSESTKENKAETTAIGLERLNLGLQNENDHDTDDDDEDEIDGAMGDPHAAEGAAGLGLRQTALALLMSIMESNQEMSSENTPLLRLIVEHLRRIQKEPKEDLQEIAGAALLLISIRDAAMGGSNSNDSRITSNTDKSQTMSDYQEALKLLQDPLLPVRAHGLILLQDVVRAKDFDPRLAPAIMGVFMQSLRDDDSYVYLNAIKGLSSLVDGLGREILQTLVDDFSSNIGATHMSQKELDYKLRLGEALIQVVKRAGSALSIYGSALVPPLLRMFPASNLPTVLRGSTLSILGVAVYTDRNAILPWRDDLLRACLDLVQVEMVPRTSTGRQTDPSGAPTDPTLTNDSKHPVLRRAALVLMASLIRNARIRVPTAISVPIQIHQPDQMNDADGIEVDVLNRATSVLGYVQEVDVDELVRHQAGEVLALVSEVAQGGAMF